MFIPLPQSRSPNGGEGGKTIHHPSDLPGFTPKDFFLCRSVKTELAILSLSQESFNMILDGAIQTITKDEFVYALQG